VRCLLPLPALIFLPFPHSTGVLRRSKTLFFVFFYCPLKLTPSLSAAFVNFYFPSGFNQILWLNFSRVATGIPAQACSLGLLISPPQSALPAFERASTGLDVLLVFLTYGPLRRLSPDAAVRFLLSLRGLILLIFSLPIPWKLDLPTLPRRPPHDHDSSLSVYTSEPLNLSPFLLKSRISLPPVSFSPILLSRTSQF